MGNAVRIAVLGDLHGQFDVERDATIVAGADVVLCTGDLTPNRGRARFDEALRQARGLARLGAWTLLGNHDGPTCFTGRRFPRSYRQLEEALEGRHLGGRRVELPELDLTLVGARPMSCGGPELRFPVPDREDWTLDDWGRALADLLDGAEQGRTLVLGHGGPTGLGERRTDIYGRDFGGEEGDWGDPDLRLALDAARSRDRIVAVVAGHMHHRLQGGGTRRRLVREGGLLHVNAAVVPRVDASGRRALLALEVSGMRATAAIEWHAPDGSVEREDLDDVR